MLEAKNSNYTCWRPSIIGPDTKQVWSGATVANSIWAKIHNGVLDSLELDTAGVKTQDYTLSLLKEKFGEPSRFDQVPYQNSFGAKFIVYEAEWHTPYVHVRFVAALSGKLNEGMVTIQTPRAYAEMNKYIEESWRKQPKF
jgi:hypothetical protein